MNYRNLLKNIIFINFLLFNVSILSENIKNFKENKFTYVNYLNDFIKKYGPILSKLEKSNVVNDMLNEDSIINLLEEIDKKNQFYDDIGKQLKSCNNYFKNLLKITFLYPIANIIFNTTKCLLLNNSKADNRENLCLYKTNEKMFVLLLTEISFYFAGIFLFDAINTYKEKLKRKDLNELDLNNKDILYDEMNKSLNFLENIESSCPYK